MNKSKIAAALVCFLIPAALQPSQLLASNRSYAEDRIISSNQGISSGVFQAPQATVYTGEKAPVSIREYKGKVILAAAWTTWCETCLQEFNLLRTLAEKYEPERLSVLAINMTTEEQSMKTVSGFLGTADHPFQILYDLNGDFQKKFHVTQVPTIMLIDHYGQVIKTFDGDAALEDIENWIPQ